MTQTTVQPINQVPPIYFTTGPIGRFSIIWGHNGKVGVAYLPSTKQFYKSDFGYNDPINHNRKNKFFTLDEACLDVGCLVPKWQWVV